MRNFVLRVNISAHLGFARFAGLKPYNAKCRDSGYPLGCNAMDEDKTGGSSVSAGQTGSCATTSDPARFTLTRESCHAPESNDMDDPDC